MKAKNNLLINDYPLMVLPELAVKIGLNEAIILQQIHWWINKGANIRDDRSWVYNTFEGWHKQFPFWSVKTIKRAMAELEKNGIVVSTSQYNRMPIDKTKWYTIDYEKLDLVSRPSGQNDPSTGTEWPDTSGQNDPSNNHRSPETPDIDDVYKAMIHHNVKFKGMLEVEKAASFLGELEFDLINYYMQLSAEKPYSYFEKVATSSIKKGVRSLADLEAQKKKEEPPQKKETGGRLEFLKGFYKEERGGEPLGTE